MDSAIPKEKGEVIAVLMNNAGNFLKSFFSVFKVYILNQTMIILSLGPICIVILQNKYVLEKNCLLEYVRRIINVSMACAYLNKQTFHPGLNYSQTGTTSTESTKNFVCLFKNVILPVFMYQMTKWISVT